MSCTVLISNISMQILIYNDTVVQSISMTSKLRVYQILTISQLFVAADKIDKSLDDEIFSNKDDETRRYLMC